MFKKVFRWVVLGAAAYGFIVAGSKAKQKMDVKKAGGNPKDVKWFK